MAVVDLEAFDSKGNFKRGHYIDGYLKDNLDGAPAYLKKDFDLIGIVSGSAKVRTGKSVVASQCAKYLSTILKTPFSLENNVVFTPEELRDKALNLPKNSVIVYDEGRTGLDSKRSMENINKKMSIFFEQVGFKNHVIIIVLPDFFDLGKQIAVSRSKFLINVYLGEKSSRGFYSFFSERKKERLYVVGKKLVGSYERYNCVNPDFRGRFYDWSPYQKDIYEQRKYEALEMMTQDKASKKDMDLVKTFCFILNKLFFVTPERIISVIDEIQSKIKDEYDITPKLNLDFYNRSAAYVAKAIGAEELANKDMIKYIKEFNENYKKKRVDKDVPTLIRALEQAVKAGARSSPTKEID